MDPSAVTLDPVAPDRRASVLGPRTAAEDREIALVRQIARWMDSRAIDPIVGFLLPGVGDLIGSAFGLYVVAIAARRRVPPIVIARMLLNLGLDALLGALPLAGDLADIAFRAHRRNADLLVARHATGGRSRADQARDWAAVLGAALLLVVAVALAVWGAIAAVRAIARAV
jgi:hypothetical protein